MFYLAAPNDGSKQKQALVLKPVMKCQVNWEVAELCQPLKTFDYISAFKHRTPFTNYYFDLGFHLLMPANTQN